MGKWQGELLCEVTKSKGGVFHLTVATYRPVGRDQHLRGWFMQP